MPLRNRWLIPVWIALLLSQTVFHPMLIVARPQRVSRDAETRLPTEVEFGEIEDPRKPASELREKHGTLFRAQGYVMDNIQRRYLFIAVPLPRRHHLQGGWWHQTIRADPFIMHLPDHLKSERHQRLQREAKNLDDYQKMILQKLEDTVWGMLPNPIELSNTRARIKMGPDIQGRAQYWYGHKLQWPNQELDDGKSQLWAKGIDDFQDLPDKQQSEGRSKRAIFSAIVAGVGAIAGLVSSGVRIAGAWQQLKADRARNKAMALLYKRQSILGRATINAQDDQMYLINNTVKAITRIESQLKKGHTRILKLYEEFGQIRGVVRENTEKLRILEWMHRNDFSVYAEYVDANRQMDLYSAWLDEFRAGLETLATGRIPSIMVPANQLREYLDMVNKDLEKSDWELVLTHVHEYHRQPLSRFTNTPDHVLIQMPLLIKRRVQKPMNLYSIQTVPVPATEKTYTFDEHVYTQITPNETFMATNRRDFLSIAQHELTACTKVDLTYLCEQTFLVRDIRAPSCFIQIFANPLEPLPDSCPVELTVDRHPTPAVMDAGDTIVLASVPGPWSVLCGTEQRSRALQPMAYTVIDKTEFCKCSLTAGHYVVPIVYNECESAPQDYKFTTAFVYNRLLMDTLIKQTNATRYQQRIWIREFVNRTNVPPKAYLDDSIIEEAKALAQECERQNKAQTCHFI